MARYIDADKLTYSRVRIIHSDGTMGGWNAVVMSSVIKDAPAADVVEVRHGYWILWKPRRENRNATYKCSVCGKLRSSYYNDVGEWEYCPCGARMDGERKEQT